MNRFKQLDDPVSALIQKPGGVNEMIMELRQLKGMDANFSWKNRSGKMIEGRPGIVVPDPGSDDDVPSSPAEFSAKYDVVDELELPDGLDKIPIHPIQGMKSFENQPGPGSKDVVIPSFE